MMDIKGPDGTAHAKDDLNVRMRAFEDTFSLDAAHFNFFQEGAVVEVAPAQVSVIILYCINMTEKSV